MQLRIFSVVGEALNFGGRRMATIMRVAWLPVVMLLILNMATVFAYLTVIFERVITFEDAVTFTVAKAALAGRFTQAFQTHPTEMWAITIASLFMQALLTASFMAPLIRYSGLGEKPHGGIIRMPFGADQIRYILAGVFSFLFIVLLILAPMAGATYYILKYIFEALSQTMASFPNADSLHTIEFVTVGEQLAANGSAWYLNLGIPLLAVVPFALMIWLLVFQHFHPRNRPNAHETGNPFLRGIVTMSVVAAAIFATYFAAQKTILSVFKSVGGANQTFEGIVKAAPENVQETLTTTLETIVPTLETAKQIIANTPANAHVLIGAVIFLLVGYLNLRLYPYPGIVVNRKSMGFAKILRVTRGWNLIRMQVILLFIAGMMLVVQYLINNFALAQILNTLNSLYQLVATSTRLVGSGVTADWVYPLFVWIWNGIKILANIYWLFFSYGVVAGLYGRLYRESERDEGDEPPKPFGKAIWRRN